MDPATTRTVGLFVGALSLLVMLWFISQRAMKNRMKMIEDNAPKIAGEDTLEGGARNPQQFDEPDDDALDEMAKLLGEDDESEMEA
jgi:F0F1-type ATP synthase membrane subunit b/b'